jgi:aminopeptidase N
VHWDFTTGDENFESETTVTFLCRRPGESTFIEFSGPAVHLAELNGHRVGAHLEGGRLRLDGLAGENSVRVRATGSFNRDGTGISWFRDPVDGRTYLHSQFAEHATYLGYACFDQPDLKATFAFSARTPAGWVAVSNTAGDRGADGVWTFPTTPVISTYITAIVAGEYHAIHRDHRGIPLGLYCRRSLAQYLDPREIFEITGQGFDFFERRFGHRYPFRKYDQLYIPEFASGAMENMACVTHNERMIYRSKVTDAQRIYRAETILHEMAHMWFGDLVTMKWWDDLWLNESFAEYMGYLGTAQATRFKTAWMEFANDTKAAARRQDQLPTTHPIVADIPDVESVALNLDRITYNKGAAALQQLVAWVGEDAFFSGVEQYFTDHAYGNTELTDFLAALEKTSGRDLRAWSRGWLETAGVNTLEAVLEIEGGAIRSAALRQSAPADHPTLRAHRLRVGLFDLADDGRLKRRRAVELDIDGAETPIPELAGERAPDLVLVNDQDLTYCKVRFDGGSLETLRRHLRDIEDPLARALAWGALWDMARDAELRARDYIALSLDHVLAEAADASTLESLISRIENAVNSFSEPAHRPAARSLLAQASKDHMGGSKPGGDAQLLWTLTFIDAARALPDVAWVQGLLEGQTRLEGLAVDFNVRWSAVKALATIGGADEEVIAEELRREPTDEGQKRAAAARAARPLPGAKQWAWDAVIHDGVPSLSMKLAIAQGFHHVDHHRLLSAFVKPYFDSLMSLWESHDSEEAIDIARATYPRAVITQEVVDATDAALANDLPPPLRRTLLESQDAIKRALRAQAFDSAGTDSPRGA